MWIISCNFDGVLYVFVVMTQRYFGWNDSDIDKIKVKVGKTSQKI